MSKRRRREKWFKRSANWMHNNIIRATLRVARVRVAELNRDDSLNRWTRVWLGCHKSGWGIIHAGRHEEWMRNELMKINDRKILIALVTNFDGSDDDDEVGWWRRRRVQSIELVIVVMETFWESVKPGDCKFYCSQLNLSLNAVRPPFKWLENPTDDDIGLLISLYRCEWNWRIVIDLGMGFYGGF